jgi:hypothetical protein
MRRKPAPLAVRRYLVSVYVTQGYEAAKPLAIKYGYPPRYLNHMAKDILGRRHSVFYKNSPFVEFESYRFDPRFIVRTTDENSPHRHRSSVASEGTTPERPRALG